MCNCTERAKDFATPLPHAPSPPVPVSTSAPAHPRVRGSAVGQPKGREPAVRHGPIWLRHGGGGRRVDLGVAGARQGQGGAHLLRDRGLRGFGGRASHHLAGADWPGAQQRTRAGPEVRLLRSTAKKCEREKRFCMVCVLVWGENWCRVELSRDGGSVITTSARGRGEVPRRPKKVRDQKGEIRDSQRGQVFHRHTPRLNK